MFKILKSLSQSLSGSKPAAEVKKPAAAASKGGVLNQVVKGNAAPAVPAKVKTPEELCEITPKMSKDEIRDQLKLLYRRFNRSASSLDAKVRGEAETMLNAIVEVREKHFCEI
jgi:hypothetical protein